MKLNKVVSLRKLLLLFILSLIVVINVSCRRNTENIDYDEANSALYSNEQFINLISKEARRIGQEYNIYASVMIAQGSLETGFGQSMLSKEPDYNLFGIKGSYNGKSADHKTWEDYEGNIVHMTDTFKSYPSFKESMEDYAELITKGANGDPEYYSGAWKSNTKDYRDATSALTGVYATDSSYNIKLNELIETYNLTKYDYATNIKVSGEEDNTLVKISSKYNIDIELLRKLNPSIEDENFEIENGKIVVIHNDYYSENFSNPIHKEFKVKKDYGEIKEGFNGILLQSDSIVEVYSTNIGTVVEVSEDEINEKYIILQHENGMYSYYSNLTDIKVEVGNQVDNSMIIGTIENDKFLKKGKLNFAISVELKDKFQNPELFIEFK